MAPYQAIDVTDVTLGENDLWLGTRTGAGGTATLACSFFARSPWLHGQQGCAVLPPSFGLLAEVNRGFRQL